MDEENIVRVLDVRNCKCFLGQLFSFSFRDTMDYIDKFAEEVDGFCRKYEKLQKSSIGLEFKLVPLRLTETIESITEHTEAAFNSSSDGSEKVTSAFVYLEGLHREVALMVRILQFSLKGPARKTAGSRMSALKDRIDELFQLIECAKVAIDRNDTLLESSAGLQCLNDVSSSETGSGDVSTSNRHQSEDRTQSTSKRNQGLKNDRKRKMPPSRDVIELSDSDDDEKNDSSTIAAGQSPEKPINLLDSSDESERDHTVQQRSVRRDLLESEEQHKKTHSKRKPRTSKRKKSTLHKELRSLTEDMEQQELFSHHASEEKLLTHAPAPAPSDSAGLRGLYNAKCILESHRKPVYSISWSNHRYTVSSTIATEPNRVVDVIATCGGACATIYEMEEDVEHSGQIPFRLRQSYTDDDKEEEFCACVFAGRSRMVNDEGLAAQLLCLAGKQRRIHVIDTSTLEKTMTLLGHGEDIMDLKVNPLNEWLLASASTDESIRLWNLKDGTPVAILSGRCGHRDAVISISWHQSGYRIASAGMDTLIKIWDVSTVVQGAISEIDSFDEARHLVERVAKHPVLLEVPIFSTNKLHVHCIDCIQFLGDMLLSKSVDSLIELWHPLDLESTLYSKSFINPKGDLQVLKKFSYSDGDLWYMRFAVDPAMNRIAVGNVKGKIFLWNVASKSSQPSHVYTTGTSNSGGTVRGVAFSPCGRTLVASLEDGTLHRVALE